MFSTTRLPLLRGVQRRAILWPESTIQRQAKATFANTENAGAVGQPKVKTDGVHVDDGKLPARAPLVKNFFVGVVDKELLGYPEPIEREQLATLKNQVLPMREFFKETIDNTAIHTKRMIPSNVLEQLRELGLYGTTIPLKYDGKGWGWTESIFASEPEASCPDVALGLSSHRVIIDLLLEKGSAEQQQRYLSRMINGSLVGAEAIYEYDAPQDDYFNTKVDYDPTLDAWRLTGCKSFVPILNGQLPGVDQLFVVIAQMKQKHLEGDRANCTAVFLIDSSMPGVKLGDRHITLGCRGLPMHHVHFDNVKLTTADMIGMLHEATDVADVLLRSSRLRSASIAVGVSKNVLNNLTQFCLQAKHCNADLREMKVMKDHISKALCSVYAMESMLYMTSGILDEFRSPDVTTEAAIVKYYSLTRLFKLATKYLEIIGPKALHEGEYTQNLFRQAAQLNSLGEMNDTLRFYIALTGLHFAGFHMQDNIRKSRNPLYHPGHIVKKFFDSSNVDMPKTKMDLAGKLHPSLEPAAQAIEHSVARLQMSVETLLTHHGGEVANEHPDLARLSEMATLIYSMFCSASRASRSYCIGLPLSDYELLTASTVCAHGRDKVYRISKDIFNGKYLNNDENLQRLGPQVIKNGYFTSHPLSFNF